MAYSSDIDPSTENFMTGYHVVFDREKKVLGWKNLDCMCYSSICTHSYAPWSYLWSFFMTKFLYCYAGYDTEDHHTYLLNHAPTVSLLLLLMDYVTILFQNQRKIPARIQLLLCLTIVIPLFWLAFYSPSSSSYHRSCDFLVCCRVP